VEFGANGRWRLLVKDPSGALVPVSSTVPGSQGIYMALFGSQDQLEVWSNGGPGSSR
jgi:hypothetical protein